MTHEPPRVALFLGATPRHAPRSPRSERTAREVARELDATRARDRANEGDAVVDDIEMGEGGARDACEGIRAKSARSRGYFRNQESFRDF